MDRRDLVVVVTGATSGIGNACATLLAKKGWRVFGTGRNPQSHEKKADEFFELVAMDVTDDASVARASEAILAKAGRVDALICSAGIGTTGSVEDSSMEEAKLQMETDFFGTVRVIKAFLPSMRTSGRGRILALSSISGTIGLPFHPFYSAGKLALEGLIECLRFELRPFGVEACLIESGDFRTAFSTSRRSAKRADASSAYAKEYEAAMEVRRRDEERASDPIAVAKLVFKLLATRKMPARKSVGRGLERFALVAKRMLPGRLSEALCRMYYHLPK